MTILEARQRIAEYKSLFDAAAATAYDFPKNKFCGRGIVICAGGAKYLPPAWVCIQMLRFVGCTLPIELWHIDAKEMPERFRDLVASFGVRCVDASLLPEYNPERRLVGWELKCFALLYSTYAQVLLLDADNVAILDPSALFETKEFRDTGAIFWPDFSRLSNEREIWHICGIPYQDEPEFESGQIVVDKAKCWSALHLAMHMNERSEFYYRFIHGDKETFHMAWRKLKLDYAMPTHPITPLQYTMCQHDFHGRRVFQHRNMDKWRLDRENPKVAGFKFEDECRGFLRDLVTGWHQPAKFVNRWYGHGKSDDVQAVADDLIAAKFVYHRVGYDFRTMAFKPNGSVGLGAAARELYWDIRPTHSERLPSTTDKSVRQDRFELILSDQSGPTCILRNDVDGIWRGRWLSFEKMPVELIPQPHRLGRGPAQEGHTFAFAERFPRLIHQIWLGPAKLPAGAEVFSRGWRRMHPKWHYQLWTESEIANWDFPERTLFENASNPAMRADILRYVILNRYGGLYVDTDFECLRPIDALLREVDSECFAGIEPPTVSYRWSVCNALIGSLPQSTFLSHLLKKLPESIEIHMGAKATHGAETIPRATGPAFFTRCASECLEVTVFPQPILYPRPHELTGAYARHHFHGSWRGVGDQQCATPCQPI